VRARLAALWTGRARQVGESLGASVAIQVALFASGIVMARSLGPSGRGDLAVLLILPSVALQVASLGLPAAATYYIAKNRPAVVSITRRLVAPALWQTAVTVILLFGLILAFFGWKAGEARTAGLLLIAGVPVFAVQYYALHIMQGLEELRWFNVFRVINPIAFSAGLGIGAVFGLTVVSCTAIWLATLVLTMVFMLVALAAKMRRAERSGPLSGPVPSQGEMVRFGAAGFLAQVSPVETFRVDTLVVASLFPSSIVGYYAVALSISNAPRFIADGIVAVAYPQVAAQNPTEGRASSRRYMIAAAVGCGVPTVVLALASPWVIPLLFGNEFHAAVTLSAILVVSAGLVSVRRVGTDCLRGLGEPGATTTIEIVTLIALAVGFVVLARWGEGKGVAVALIFSAVVGLGLTLRALRDPERSRSAPLARLE
jgi:O-antigen/teichoic acid export membrane protein